MLLPLRSGFSAFILLPLAVGLGAYLLALHGPLFFDDLPNITQNTLLKIDGSVLDDWRAAALSSNAGILRRPVAMLSFAANHALSGEFNPAVMKAVNLGVHCLIGVLIFYWCLALLATPALQFQIPAQQRSAVALFAAALWFLQPLHVSTVLYVVQRMAQVSTLFVILGLWVFTRYRLRWAAQGATAGEVVAAGMWLALLAVLAALSKENGALLPWLILAVEVTLFRGIWGGVQQRWLVAAGWVALLLPLMLGLGLLVFIPESLIGGYVNRDFSLGERVLTQARMLWTYISWTLLPDITAMGFQHDDIRLSSGLLAPITTLLSVVAWMAAVLIAWIARTRMPMLLFVVLFYLIGHSLESGVIPLEMVYEHRNYLPSIAICIGVAVTLWHFSLRYDRLSFPAMAGFVVAVFAVVLATRATIWSDEETLFRFNVVNHPDSPRANFLYADTLLRTSQDMQTANEDVEGAKARMVAARHYLTEMYKLDPRDVAAPVLLYQIDLTHFPGMPDRKDWLEGLESVLVDRPLQASDFSALVSLVKFSEHGSSETDKRRISAILEALIARYPRRVELQVQHYLLSKTMDHHLPGEGIAMLSAAESTNPAHLELYGYQIYANREQGNEAAAFEAARNWLKEDRQRRQLPALRRAF